MPEGLVREPRPRSGCGPAGDPPAASGRTQPSLVSWAISATPSLSRKPVTLIIQRHCSANQGCCCSVARSRPALSDPVGCSTVQGTGQQGKVPTDSLMHTGRRGQVTPQAGLGPGVSCRSSRLGAGPELAAAGGQEPPRRPQLRPERLPWGPSLPPTLTRSPLMPMSPLKPGKPSSP